MDKETFRFLKHILKVCETKGEEAINDVADQAERSKNLLFERMAEGSLEHLVELQDEIMNGLYELADKTDKKVRNGTFGRDDEIQCLAKFVSNIHVLRECNRLIKAKLTKMNKKD